MDDVTVRCWSVTPSRARTAVSKEALPLPGEVHVPPNSSSSKVSALGTTAGAWGATVTAGSVRALVVNCPPSPKREC